MRESNTDRDDVAIIGAGVVGCAIAWALTKAGFRVLLIDRADPATAGASFGNVGHIATEQLQPLPSPRLLVGFWRELLAFDGPLDIPLRRVPAMAAWMTRFAVAAFRQKAHMNYLAPLVKCAADRLESQLGEIGRRDLMRRNGHYALWLGAKARERAAAQRKQAAELEIDTGVAPEELLRAAAHAAATAASQDTVQSSAAPAQALAPRTRDVNKRALAAAGVWFPDSAHVLDPASVARAFASAAAQCGATMRRTSVKRIHPRGDRIEIVTDADAFCVRTAVVCAGAWSAPLLTPFGLHAPLEAERGYHIELPGHAPLTDSPILYADHSVVVTPMASRLRASSDLEFAGLNAPPDPRKPARLRAKLRQLGYQCDPDGPSWMGPRPTLPDYLPGIGRANGKHALFYAVGHQHLGLTLAAVTAELITDLVCSQKPRFDITAFDLRRFGEP